MPYENIPIIGYRYDKTYHPNGAICCFKGMDRFLSNFWPAHVEYNGRAYKSAEAAFQAQKCADPADSIAFENLSALDAKKLGRKVDMRPDWDDVKVRVMYAIVLDKFERNEDLRIQLLGTWGMILVEGNDWGDRFWGVDIATNQGDNMLGQILQAVRAKLKDRAEPEFLEKCIAERRRLEASV